MPKRPSGWPTPPPAPDAVVRLSVRVQPKASRNRVSLDPSGTLRVWVTAPPADHEANRAVCDLLASELGVSRSSVKIEKGDHSRNKHVAVTGITEEAFKRYLNSLKRDSA